ncbi:MAG TPA: universal stress protein [Candidatus Binatia bacterium]|nr:universal stress protein [Candidatus Binatia bacterium]
MVDGFKRIMLPVDFSEHCDRAAEHAAWFARISGGTVHLVHVITNPADPLYQPQEVPHWVMVEHSEEKARALLADAAQRCLPADCPHECHVLQGDPHDKLLEAAKRIEPDLIVMSTHGRGGVAHLVIGSVTEKMVRHSPCPVFVIHRPVASKRHAGSPGVESAPA